MNGPQAEILSIGTELLLGEIVDTNTPTIARALRSIGMNLYRTSSVGDNVDRIARAVREACTRADVLIATGGLGPTADDMTRAGIAAALATKIEFRPELWAQIQERFARFGTTPGDTNRRQAYLPHGATAIENPLGTAPAFRAELEGSVVFALPGVPAEMEHLLVHEVLPFLRERYALHGTIQSRILRTAGVGESTLEADIADLEQAANPTLGVSAHPGRVDLRLTARADTEREAEAMLAELEAEIRRRLGDRIYGVDNETLESVVLGKIEDRGWQLVTVEAGTGGALTAALSPLGIAYHGGLTLPSPPEDTSLLPSLEREMPERGADAGLALLLEEDEENLTMRAWLRTPAGERDLERSYGRPLANAEARAVALCLEMTRRELQDPAP